MKSIRDLYKIGKGPSSSHTMGPERAARIFKQEHPDAERYEVTLYGSLALTGVGHGTDRVLSEVLSPTPTEIIFSDKDPDDLKHPNTLDFAAYKGEEKIASMRVESIGGGEAAGAEEIYPENSFAEIAQYCRWRYISLREYVELNEGPEIWDFLQQIWRAMRSEVEEGLEATGILPGGLGVQRKAKYLYERQHAQEIPQVRELQLVCLRLRRGGAERRQRHHRHRAHLRQLRRAARGPHVSAGQIPLFRPAHGARARRGGHHRQSDPAQRVHLRRRMRLSGGGRLGMFHGGRRHV